MEEKAADSRDSQVAAVGPWGWGWQASGRRARGEWREEREETATPLALGSGQSGGQWTHLLRRGRVRQEQEKNEWEVKSSSLTLSAPDATRHPSEDEKQATGSLSLELRRKVRAGLIRLGVICVQLLLFALGPIIRKSAEPQATSANSLRFHGGCQQSGWAPADRRKTHAKRRKLFKPTVHWYEELYGALLKDFTQGLDVQIGPLERKIWGWRQAQVAEG